MGGLPGLLGLGGGASGTGFAGPQGTTIATPTTTDQANQAYNSNQQALGSQQALLSALQGQNGLGNQSQVYNQLQGVVNGTGPNPAQAMLNQATGQNVANQAALMAGQRGAGANVGLMARQAAQQGAATQQAAVGQGASMQANQALNALSSAGNIANTQVGNQIGATSANTQAQQAEQANLLNAISGQNNANISMQSNINNANAGLANTQLQGQQAMTGGLLSAVSGPGASMMGGARGGMVRRYEEGGDVDTPDMTPPETQAPVVGGGGGQGTGGFAAGVDASSGPNIGSTNFGPDSGAQALASGVGALGGGKSQGGGGGGGGGGMMSMLPMLAALAEGGSIDASSMGSTPVVAASGPQSNFGQFLSGVQVGSGPNIGSVNLGSDAGAAALQKGTQQAGKAAMSSKQPQTVNVNDSTAAKEKWGFTDLPGAEKATDTSMQNNTDTYGNAMSGSIMAARGGMTHDYRAGGKVQARNAREQAVKPGNNYANDKIPALLSDKEIVLPREVTMAPDPVKASAEFVAKIIAQRKVKGKR